MYNAVLHFFAQFYRHRSFLLVAENIFQAVQVEMAWLIQAVTAKKSSILSWMRKADFVRSTSN
jgi:hypothetical protein